MIQQNTIQKQLVKLTAKLGFLKYKKEYSYDLNIEPPVTHHKIATEISKEIIKANKKRGVEFKRGHSMPGYNLTMFLLKKLSVDNRTEPIKSLKEDAFRTANELNKNEPFHKTECPECNGKDMYSSGLIKNILIKHCQKCNGRGFVYQRIAWRVGKSFNKNLALDIDNHDEFNLKLIMNHLNELFGYPFNIIKTLNGYQIIGTKIYDHLDEWLYANCLLLYPTLRKQDLNYYIIDLNKWDEQNKHDSQDFRKSSLYQGTGDFDVMFTVLSIKHQKSTFRISKKTKDDKNDLIHEVL